MSLALLRPGYKSSLRFNCSNRFPLESSKFIFEFKAGGNDKLQARVNLYLPLIHPHMLREISRRSWTFTQ